MLWNPFWDPKVPRFYAISLRVTRAEKRPGREETVREVYRRRLATVDAEVADHKARGESLLGREKDFTIRCN